MFKGRIAAVLALVLCFAFFSTYFLRKYTNTSAFMSDDKRPVLILDAGHEALENTIKTPKNHRQANVEIIPKTRCISGF